MSTRPVLLDTFCGAGGAGKGYADAGFDVVGVDINPQPHYPYEFVQGDALEFIARYGREFDAIHASPPCQGYSSSLQGLVTKIYPLLIAETKEMCMATDRPWVIENVRPMRSVPAEHRLNGIILCGSAFGLRIWRHRWFEASFAMLAPSCNHDQPPLNPYKAPSRKRDGITGTNDPIWKEAMGVEWMTGKEATEAIPPIYTRYIGGHLLALLKAGKGATT